MNRSCEDTISLRLGFNLLIAKAMLSAVHKLKPSLNEMVFFKPLFILNQYVPAICMYVLKMSIINACELMYIDYNVARYPCQNIVEKESSYKDTNS